MGTIILEPLRVRVRQSRPAVLGGKAGEWLYNRKGGD
jgi:hypothetical protein